MQEQPRDTPQRLLDAAETLFAEHGFDAVSVREISQAAAVNVAAVNYHFQGKEGLYREVLHRIMSAKQERYLASLEGMRPGEAGLEELLRTFYRLHFEDTLKNERGAAFMKLLVRELHHGDPQRREQINALLAPLWSGLQEALLRVVPGLGDRTAAWVIGSLHGQLIHFTMRWHRQTAIDDACAGNFFQTIFPPLAEDVDRYIDQAVEHIARFSTAGIRALLAGDPPQPSTREERL